MALIKTLKFVNGVPTEVNPASDSIAAYTFIVGGSGGTALTQAILNTLTGGTSSDASSLHIHDSRYYQKTQHIALSTGVAQAGVPMITDARGKIDPSLIQQSDISHSNLTGLASGDDHTQYHNDTRGDARYYKKTEFVNASTGATDAGKPVKLNASGLLDSSMLSGSAAAIDHENLSGLLGGAASDHYHITGAQRTALTGGSSTDASSQHNHNTQYYTKAQMDTSLGAKADANAVMLLNGTQAMTQNMPLGGHKITGMADGSAATDAATVGQMSSADALKLSLTGGTMAGVLNMGGFAITNLPAPTDPSDPATKGYVDAAQAGLIIKDPVLVASISNLGFSGPAPLMIDGVTVPNGSRILLKDQTNAAQNGIYAVSVSGGTFTLTRATDFNSSSTIREGAYVYVDEGDTWAGTTWVMSSSDPITVGTSDIVWKRYSGAGQITAGVGLEKTGDTLDLLLGAGIKELPTDEIGLDLHANSALELVDPASGNPSSASDAQLAIKLNGNTLSKGASGLGVAAAGITATELASSVAGAGLSGGAGAALTVNAGDGIQIATDAVAVKVSDFAGAGLEDDGSNNLRLAASVAGAGLAHSAGVLSVNVDGSTMQITGDTLSVKTIGSSNLGTDSVQEQHIDWGTGANQVSAVDVPLADTANNFTTKNVEAALAQLAKGTHTDTFVTGEAIGIGDLVCVRRDGTNALKAYKASASATDNVAAASLTLGDVVFNAVNNIAFSGNAITIAFINPGAANAALSASATGNAITVSLATNASAAIVSTAAQIVSVINTTPSTNVLVTASTSNGSAIQAAQAATRLSGGMDYNDNGRWRVKGVALDSSVGAGTTIRVQKRGELACNFVSAPAANDIGKSVYLSINQGKAVVYLAPSGANEGLVYLGDLISSTQVAFEGQPILRGVNG